MADDEQFSLCWNNFNSNLSAGFHESLCKGDLVDVTLAAEGQLVKAHRLVLSVCSPYFRKMFTQMPANQHAFVFLKDVSHTALKDLIQFMYCGEVNVKQEALPAFISTAEALQIKGLTDSDPPQSQSPAEPSTPTPQIQQIASPRVRQRTSTTRSYKIDSVDEQVEQHKQPTQIVIQTTAAAPQATITQQQTHLQQNQQQHNAAQQISTTAGTTTTVVTHKRPAQRNMGSAPHIKRTKSTIDPLDVTDATNAQQQITVQTAVVTDIKSHDQSDAEYIDLPIELPTKSEPDYTDEAGEVETAEHDQSYVEDDSYGEMRYDESYFTENEDGGGGGTVTTANVSGSAAGATTSKAVVKQSTSFSDSSYVEAADQANSDAQGATTKRTGRKRGRPKVKEDVPQAKLMDKIAAAVRRNVGQPVVYASTTKGGMKLIYDGHHFKYSFRKGQYSIFRCCYKENKELCWVRVVCDQKRVFPLDGEHVHFMQATDKSVTDMMFEPAITDDNDDVNSEMPIDMPPPPVAIEHIVLQPKSETMHEETEMIISDNGEEMTTVDPSDFREKIKKRLQKALLGKKK